MIKSWFERLLQTFDYESIEAFLSSLAPSSKYGLFSIAWSFSALGVSIEKVFGLDGAAFWSLIVIMVFELVTGLCASAIRKEAVSSMRASRFSLKMAAYLICLGVTYLMAESFLRRGKTMAYVAFDWMNIFLTLQIVLEQIISILENVAVMDGKPKDHWIKIIREKLGGLLK